MRNGLSKFGAVAVLVTISLFALTNDSIAQSTARFSFLAISDVPYTAREDYTLSQRTRPAIMPSNLPFVLFLGDFKNAKIPCSAFLMTKRRDQILGLHPGRVFYTPGDNDWTDCDRRQIRQRFSELNRLDLLRRLFYTAPMELPPEWLYERQSLFPENMRWVYNNVLFATLHLVSTNNGRDEILLDDKDLALTLVDARDRANLLWLDRAFTEALKVGADAVVIATQADVTRHKNNRPCTLKVRQKCNAFATITLRLRHLSAKYRKPVLLIHGDTNPYCLDKTFGGTAAPNLWRFNSTGDYSFVDAAKITVDPSNVSAPFSFTSLTQNIPPKSGC